MDRDAAPRGLGAYVKAAFGMRNPLFKNQDTKRDQQQHEREAGHELQAAGLEDDVVTPSRNGSLGSGSFHSIPTDEPATIAVWHTGGKVEHRHSRDHDAVKVFNDQDDDSDDKTDVVGSPSYGTPFWTPAIGGEKEVRSARAGQKVTSILFQHDDCEGRAKRWGARPIPKEARSDHNSGNLGRQRASLGDPWCQDGGNLRHQDRHQGTKSGIASGAATRSMDGTKMAKNEALPDRLRKVGGGLAVGSGPARNWRAPAGGDVLAGGDSASSLASKVPGQHARFLAGEDAQVQQFQMKAGGPAPLGSQSDEWQGVGGLKTGDLKPGAQVMGEDVRQALRNIVQWGAGAADRVPAAGGRWESRVKADQMVHVLQLQKELEATKRRVHSLEQQNENLLAQAKDMEFQLHEFSKDTQEASQGFMLTGTNIRMQLSWQDENELARLRQEFEVERLRGRESLMHLEAERKNRQDCQMQLLELKSMYDAALESSQSAQEAARNWEEQAAELQTKLKAAEQRRLLSKMPIHKENHLRLPTIREAQSASRIPKCSSSAPESVAKKRRFGYVSGRQL
ncbi:unnamed protein product [Ostreobium quekettii]|uniref:Uncharacterized protein n=1 Tax=Ostreobium quekettii TaxID=121088 RepID=A0A8S1IXM7_9CHLO|nr:unnamed protein product [Ostreobium quekettii]